MLDATGIGTSTGIYVQSGTVKLGNNDNSINREEPSIYGANEGIRNENGVLEFYDGVVEGEPSKSIISTSVTAPEGLSVIKKLVGNRERATLDNDNIAPVIEVRNLNEGWSKDFAIIEVTAIDNESEIEGIYCGGERLVLIEGSVARMEIFDNNLYTFTARDIAGNTAEAQIRVNNIDKIAPTIENVTIDSLPGDAEVRISVEAKDDLSGVYEYELSRTTATPEIWKRVTNPSTNAKFDISVNINGDYYLFIRDAAGNVTMRENVIKISNVDVGKPEITNVRVRGEVNGIVDKTAVMIDIEANDDTGVESILVSNRILTTGEILNSSDWVPYSESILWNLETGDGEKTVYVWVRDNSGKISQYASTSVKLLGKYIGNDGDNSTSFIILIKDANFNSSEVLTNNKIATRVLKNSIANDKSYGAGISIRALPTIFGPVQQNTEIFTGKYYYITAEDIVGDGEVYLLFGTNSATDLAGNTVSTGFALRTDVIVDTGKPTITVRSSSIVTSDAEGHRMNAIKVNGKTIEMPFNANGEITFAEIETRSGFAVVAGTVIETMDQCGNTARVEVE